MPPTWIIGASLLVMAASIGSFINVVALRLPLIREGAIENGRLVSLSYPDSRCPGCRQRIPWHFNVPVLGWIALRGRCSCCKNPIATIYPLVEAGAAGLGVIALVCLGSKAHSFLFAGLLLSLYAQAACTLQHPLRSEKTAMILLVSTLLPMLFALLPWFVAMGQAARLLDALGSNPIPSLVVITALMMIELIFRKLGYPLQPVGFISLVTLALLFSPVVMLVIWLVTRSCAATSLHPPSEPVITTRLAAIVLPALILLSLHPGLGIAMMSHPWAVLLHGL